MTFTSLIGKEEQERIHFPMVSSVKMAYTVQPVSKALKHTTSNSAEISWPLTRRQSQSFQIDEHRLIGMHNT